MNNSHFENGHPRTRGARTKKEDLTPGSAIPIRFGTVPSFDETPIFYCTEGEGELLVFCYGLGCSSLHWTYQVDYFRKNYKCVWFDFRGHHNTPIPESHGETRGDMTVSACAKDLKAILDFLEIKTPAILLGHSMGVSVVLQFTHLYPERVKSLVLANGTAKRPLDTLLGGNFFYPAFRAFSHFEKEKPSLVQSLWKFQKKTSQVETFLGAVGFNRGLTSPEDIKTYARQLAELPAFVISAMMDDYQKFDSTPWLHDILTKTLVISGDEDKVTPPETQALIAQLMPNAELVHIQNGSHCTPLDFPDYINLVIERFIK